jgi:hypothetical protein
VPARNLADPPYRLLLKRLRFGRASMNHSIAHADGATHFKIAILALVAAVVVVIVGFSARVAEPGIQTVRAESAGPAVKAVKVIRVTTSSGFEARKI